MSKPLAASANPASTRARGWRNAVLPALGALVLVALTLGAYRELAARPFAADDYQWLLNVRGLSFGQVVARAFDASAQSHFFRPLVWLLFWAQMQLFGLEPRGYHLISLGLHLANAGMLGGLAWRLGARRWAALLAAGIVTLHPALFEAVVWVSAQSELLAALLLLLVLHVWVPQMKNDERRTTNDKVVTIQSKEQRIKRQDHDGITKPFRHRVIRSSGHRVIVPPAHPLICSLLATALLALALLAKESAVIGLPLLALLGSGGRGERSRMARFGPYVLPVLLTAGYLWLQRGIEARNYLLQNGGYGIGPQIALNPLRSLALLVAPLPGTEHADAAWLVWFGAIIAGALLALFAWGGAGTRRAVLALLLTLLPTAPFISPPDSRYLYLPVLAAALLVAVVAGKRRMTNDERRMTFTLRRALVLCALFFVLGAAWFALGEVHAREERFAAASGPGGSLWRLASGLCSDAQPERILVVEPPLAPPHAEAIVQLACGTQTQPLVLGRAEVAEKLTPGAVIVAFPNGSAEVEQTQP